MFHIRMRKIVDKGLEHAEIVDASALIAVACAKDDDFDRNGLADRTGTPLPRLLGKGAVIPGP
jgi:hypothetical protein